MAEMTVEERRMLADSLERLLKGSHERAERGPGGFVRSSRAVWAEFADLGVLALPFPEAHGGLDMGTREVATVTRILGREVSTEPYLSSILLAGGVVRLAGSGALQGELAPQLADGSLRAALAYSEPTSRFNLAHVATTASPVTDGFVLRGRKAVVLGGDEADVLFVTARTSGDALDLQGQSLFRVPAGAAGLSVKPFLLIDGRSAAELELDDVVVPPSALVGPPGGGLPILERVVDEAIVAVCSEAIGAMEMLCDQTLDYCRTRRAFGQSISSFQVVQHRLVDMRVAFEHAEAMADAAAKTIDEQPSRRAAMASAAKAVIAREGDFIGKWAVQLHGAIGVTDDLPIGRYFKRLLTINTLFGDADHHERRYYGLRRSRPLEAA